MKNKSKNTSLYRRFHQQDKMYGTTTLGSRGQVVIPALARKDLKLKAGDQLLVVGKFGKVIGLIKAQQLQEFVDLFMKNLPTPAFRAVFKRQIKKMLKLNKHKLTIN